MCSNTEFNNHHSCHSRDTEIRDLRNWSSYGASKWYNICLYVMNHNVLQDECNIRISSGRCLKHHYCLPCHQKKRSKSKFNHAQKVKIIKRMLKISIVYPCLHHFSDARPILIWIYKLEKQHFMLIDALFTQKPIGSTLKVFRFWLYGGDNFGGTKTRMKSLDKCWSSPGQGHDSREKNIERKFLQNY